MRYLEVLGILAVAAAVASCEASAAREAKSTGAMTTVDSVIPRDKALRRFREGTPQVDRLDGGEASIAGVVSSYVRALEARDTTEVARLAVNRAEFAWLYYPTTPQGLPPYDVEPGLLWFLVSSRSDKGARRALTVYGGQKLEVLNHDCGKTGTPEGDNTIWGPCTVRWIGETGDTASTQLLGQILERNRRYKVLSYSNGL